MGVKVLQHLQQLEKELLGVIGTILLLQEVCILGWVRFGSFYRGGGGDKIQENNACGYLLGYYWRENSWKWNNIGGCGVGIGLLYNKEDKSSLRKLVSSAWNCRAEFLMIGG